MQSPQLCILIRISILAHFFHSFDIPFEEGRTFRSLTVYLSQTAAPLDGRLAGLLRSNSKSASWSQPLELKAQAFVSRHFFSLFPQ